MNLKLGRAPVKSHPRTLLFSKYVAANSLPAPAARVYREYKTPPEAKQMFGNDSVGDCTCAGIANLIILWTVHAGVTVIPTVQQVLDMYSAVSGYDQKTGANDNGAAMTDVLEYMRTTGLDGRKILAWAQIDHTNLTQRRLAVDLFGATYVGVNLPQSAMDQFQANAPWEVTIGSIIVGGHAIIHPGYGAAGGDYVTWGKWDQKASSSWETAYIEEEYAIITQDWINTVTQKTPGGVDLATLMDDLHALAA